MDEADLANDHIERELAQRLRWHAIRAMAAQQGPAQCEECEADMPPVRRQMGKRLCVECQALAEKHAALRPGACR